MKTKRLGFISCLAAAALIASPALGEKHKKSEATAMAKPQRIAPRTAQMTPTYRHGISSRMGSTGGYYTGSRYDTSGYDGTGYYYAGGLGYPYYGSSSYWTYGYSGYYPYSYYQGYPYSYSYYQPAYGYGTGTIAAVQQRLGQLGYYHGVVDGVMGPQTRGAITAYESRHGLGMDGTISAPLLNRLGLT
ncbi:MAG: hypothetical protein DMF24_07265 [Verrucomicrobia bacterium]|nr:MAG: hypothetical protein DME90_01385 [Verrucomicrobiota bacterium]PYL61435.1 MAG: hypothetical protein DMF24_07265 [Verrucomicrobiota bacterium]